MVSNYLRLCLSYKHVSGRQKKRETFPNSCTSPHPLPPKKRFLIFFRRMFEYNIQEISSKYRRYQEIQEVWEVCRYNMQNALLYILCTILFFLQKFSLYFDIFTISILLQISHLVWIGWYEYFSNLKYITMPSLGYSQTKVYFQKSVVIDLLFRAQTVKQATELIIKEKTY